MRLRQAKIVMTGLVAQLMIAACSVEPRASPPSAPDLLTKSEDAATALAPIEEQVGSIDLSVDEGALKRRDDTWWNRVRAMQIFHAAPPGSTVLGRIEFKVPSDAIRPLLARSIATLRAADLGADALVIEREERLGDEDYIRALVIRARTSDDRP